MGGSKVHYQPLSKSFPRSKEYIKHYFSVRALHYRHKTATPIDAQVCRSMGHFALVLDYRFQGWRIWRRHSATVFVLLWDFRAYFKLLSSRLISADFLIGVGCVVKCHTK
jgi:hypothetical protein